MTVDSLMQTCAELGIKLALKGDGTDRLQVDAPKGALTSPLREALAANKPELIAFLKAQQQAARQVQVPNPDEDSEITETQTPASTSSKSPEATPLILEPRLPMPHIPSDHPDTDVSKPLSETEYQEATLQLRTADSPAERAGAARKLGVARNRKATADLIASLRDGAPEVRRAAAESLGQIGDPAAIAPLNDLLLHETSRQLPQSVIRDAINSITVAAAKLSGAESAAPEMTAPTAPEAPVKKVADKVSKPEVAKMESPAPTTRREIFADYLSSVEPRAPQANTPQTSNVAPSLESAPVASSFDVAEEQLRQEEEALRRAADALESRRKEAETARKRAEDEARIKAESEAQVRMEIEARLRAEEEARKRMAEEAARQQAEVEARAKAEQDARNRAEQEALLRAEEEARFRLEADTLRKAAEELARKRAEAEVARKRAAVEAEEQARREAEAEALRKAEEEARARAAEEVRRQAEEEMRRRVEAEMRRRAEEEVRLRAEEEAAQARAVEEARIRAAVEAQIRSEQEAKRKAEEEARRQAEERAAEEVRVRLAEEAARRAEEERVAQELVRREADERQRAEDARLRLEQETLMQVAAELSRRRSELEEARRTAETEARLLVEAEERARAEEEIRRQMAVERQQLELEARRRNEEEQIADTRRRAAEERLLAAEHVRLQAEEDERRLRELESVRTKAEEEAIRRAEMEQRIKAEILELSKAEEEQHLRIEAEIKRRTEAEAHLKEEEARAEQAALQMADDIRARTEEQARRRAEVETRLREEEARLAVEQEATSRVEEEAARLTEATRSRAEEEARRRAEVEARLKEEEARLQAEQEARIKAEAEEQRLAEEFRSRTEKESRRRTEVEARLREDQSRLEAEQALRARVEEEAFRLEVENRSRDEAARLRAEAEAQMNAEQAVAESHEEDLSASYDRAFADEAFSAEDSSPEFAWVDVGPDQRQEDLLPLVEEADYSDAAPLVDSSLHSAPGKEIEVLLAEKGIASAEDDAGIPSEVLKRLSSPEASEREAALAEVVRVGGDDAFRCISRAFDDQSADVRNAAAQALFDLQSDRAATFTRALREGTPERRRKIGQALAGSGLAREAVANLTGESREKTYDAFSLLFLMAKAGEVQPLMQAIEDYPNVEVRIAVVKLLALSGQPEIVPAFRRLAVRGSLPSEVRSAVMEAIYQIGSQARESAPSAA